MTIDTLVGKIRVRNLQRTIRVKIVDLGKFADRALEQCLKLLPPGPSRLKQLTEVFVLLISDRRMARLHRQFRYEPVPTDVLTFDHGEIFISVETARRNARRFGTSTIQEVRLYMVHGLLHLHGFDDRTKSGAQKMEQQQKKILLEIGRLEGLN